MPSRKQRRREQKLRRHEWEEVWVDEEGRELDPDEVPETDTAPKRERVTRASSNGKPKARAAQQPRQTRSGRVIEPPSWRRVLKRGLIFAPIMFLVVYFLRPEDATNTSLVMQVVLLLVVFVPFSYVMDVLMYRGYKRRTGDAGAAKKR